jgi:hypothetical protein
MISNEYLANQVAKSRIERRTTDFLRNLAIFTVRNSLHRHYGDNYSIRCLQSSCAFEIVLSTFGLKSRLWKGAACFAEAFANPPHTFSFGGFWDQDHHIWLFTEFGEIVDFTVSQLHLHPSAHSRSDTLQIPPIWWDDVTTWPCAVRYIPDGPIKIALPADDMKDLEEFRKLVSSNLDENLKQLEPNDVPTVCILGGPDSMQRLYKSNHPWVVGVLRYETNGFPLPDWIRQRHNELMLAWEKRDEVQKT